MNSDTLLRRYTALLTACLMLLLYSASGSSAEVYRETDKDGKVVFTDNPHSEGEQVEVRDPNTVKGVQARPQPRPTKSDTPTDHYTVTITSPTDGQVFHNRLLPITVSASTQPELQKHQSLRLLVDGTPASHSEKGLVTDGGLSIGAHTLQVQLLEFGKRVVAESEAITIYARQPGQ